MSFFWSNPVFQLTQSGPRFSYVANAAWSTKYVDALPNSAFLIIHDDGKRSLPVKNHLGNYDCDHLKNAEARANQVEGVPSTVRKRAKKKASDIFDRMKKSGACP